MSLVDLLPMTVGAVTSPPTFIDVMATFLAALSGAIFAVEREFAVTGVIRVPQPVDLPAKLPGTASAQAKRRRRRRRDYGGVWT